MKINELPKMNIKPEATGCCPRFDSAPWEDQVIEFDKKLFVKMNTINFMHVPLNMGRVMKKMWSKVQDAKADTKDHYLLLSHDPSPWKGEHYMEVTKDVPNAEMVKLSGTYLTKVFEGPYKDAGKWVKEMEKFVESKDKKIKKLYFFYTTCPKCAKTLGENYTIGFAEI